MKLLRTHKESGFGGKRNTEFIHEMIIIVSHFHSFNNNICPYHTSHSFYKHSITLKPIMYTAQCAQIIW